MKVNTIIVTYNGAQWIEKCLDSLHECKVKTHILIVDNASTDNTLSIIREKYPEVELIESAKNLGFGKANNIGLRKALDERADSETQISFSGTVLKLLILFASNTSNATAISWIQIMLLIPSSFAKLRIRVSHRVFKIQTASGNFLFTS